MRSLTCISLAPPQPQPVTLSTTAVPCGWAGWTGKGAEGSEAFSRDAKSQVSLSDERTDEIGLGDWVGSWPSGLVSLLVQKQFSFSFIHFLICCNLTALLDTCRSVSLGSGPVPSPMGGDTAAKLFPPLDSLQRKLSRGKKSVT